MVPPPMYLPCFAYLVDLFCLDGFDFRYSAHANDEGRVAGSTKFTDNIGFTNVFQGWSPKTSAKPMLSIKSMVLKPCGWEHTIHG